MAGMEKAKERKIRMSGALAIFAKTPSLSPVKTRLSASIGVPLAQEFYKLSVAAVAEIAKEVQRNSTLTPYWALAEKEAVELPQWQEFKNIWTGEGGLGARLHNIYSSLHKKHDYVMLIGTDSPQLEPELLVGAATKISEQPESCFIGPATDGGFYLFAAKVPIPRNIWTDVTYSNNTTLHELSGQLAKYNIPVNLLSTQGDVDTANDIWPLMQGLEQNRNLLPTQKKLYDWLQNQTAIFN